MAAERAMIEQNHWIYGGARVSCAACEEVSCIGMEVFVECEITWADVFLFYLQNTLMRCPHCQEGRLYVFEGVDGSVPSFKNWSELKPPVHFEKPNADVISDWSQA
jgi:hypothetical protein